MGRPLSQAEIIRAGLDATLGGQRFLPNATVTQKLVPWVSPIKLQVAAWGLKKMGLLGGLVKVARGIGGKIAGRVVGALPGGNIAKTVIGAGAKIAKRIGRKNLKKIATGGVVAIGAGGVAAGRRGGGGGGGGVMMDPMTGGMMMGGRRRRINPGNVRAMRRAIRRVEMGARLYSKMFGISRGRSIKGAPGVKVVKFRRRAA